MKKQNWYFTFGSGQPHDGCFIKFFGTSDETREKMFRAFDKQWSMQYSEEQWQNPEEGSVKLNGIDPSTKPTLADVWGWKEVF